MFYLLPVTPSASYPPPRKRALMPNHYPQSKARDIDFAIVTDELHVSTTVTIDKYVWEYVVCMFTAYG